MREGTCCVRRIEEAARFSCPLKKRTASNAFDPPREAPGADPRGPLGALETAFLGRFTAHSIPYCRLPENRKTDTFPRFRGWLWAFQDVRRKLPCLAFTHVCKVPGMPPNANPEKCK